jgi:hypothetical protein
MTAPKPVLKTLPTSGVGLSANQPVRMVKLAHPICPNSKIEMEKDATGKWVRKQGPTDPERQNCQRMGYGWWKSCEEKGHNPYFREVVWYVTEDEFDDDGLMVGEKRFRRSRTLPNISQVAVAPHLNSGEGARRAVKNKGFKRLPDIGYAEVCQYRNCMNPVDPKFVSKTYGGYCRGEELALVVAEQQGEVLHRPDARLNGNEVDKIERARQKQLNEALASGLSS